MLLIIANLIATASMNAIITKVPLRCWFEFITEAFMTGTCEGFR